MGKKVNTFLFVIGATLFNIVLTVALFLLFLVIAVRLLNVGEGAIPIVMGLISLLSIGGSFLIYGFIVQRLNKRFDMEKYLAPIFGNKRGKGGEQ
ncbi:MAG: leader peptide processing enzyme [Sphaerochaetaceae bacterium]|jgi:hypothetical protein|nr:leader peptide processing enzyme [Sphaerochaetaceae bacterium]HHU88709.1 leader peptide processing enzyme [Spirochaetales bacterium]